MRPRVHAQVNLMYRLPAGGGLPERKLAVHHQKCDSPVGVGKLAGTIRPLLRMPAENQER